MIQARQENKVISKDLVYSKDDIAILEETLAYSGMEQPAELDFRLIGIYDIDYVHEIYTVNKEKKDLPYIVLLHGFGGTAMTYVRLFKKLSQKYQVHALDTFGVGHSSHGGFKENFSYEQARDYFIDAIEAWREKIGLEEFTLVGHSFGGYIATCYTEKYTKRVNRLILLSPAGATEKTEEQIENQLKTRTGQTFRGKVFRFFAQKVFNWKVRPSKAMGNFFIGNKLLSRVVDDRLHLEGEENLCWKKYFKHLSKRDVSSEAGFYIIFQWPLKPKHTIENILEKLEFKRSIEFYYGQYDWMDSKGAQRIAQKYKNISFDRIGGAGHQLIFDNPGQICHFIMSRMEEEEEDMKK